MSSTNKLYIHCYEKFGVVSKGFYIKCYEVNWYYKSSVPFNALKCKYIIQDNHGKMMHNLSRYKIPIGRIRTIEVSHIISISPFINTIIENSHI